jgi:hypothetical protein
VSSAASDASSGASQACKFNNDRKLPKKYVFMNLLIASSLGAPRDNSARRYGSILIAYGVRMENTFGCFSRVWNRTGLS